MSIRFFLRKKERLHSKKGFALLFSKGEYFGSGSLGVRYVIDPTDTLEDWPIQMAISVPKRKFKKANQRNQLKRLIKEAYRLHRLPLLLFLKEQNRQILVFFMYKPFEPIHYARIEQDMQKALKKLKALI